MSIIEDVKNMAKLVQQAGNLELYQKMLDLQSQAMDLVEADRLRREEMTELKRQLRVKSELEFKKDSYWKESGEGPFCVPCWQKEKQDRIMMELAEGFFKCAVCGFIHKTEKRKKQEAEDKAKQAEQTRRAWQSQNTGFRRRY